MTRQRSWRVSQKRKAKAQQELAQERRQAGQRELRRQRAGGDRRARSARASPTFAAARSRRSKSRSERVSALRCADVAGMSRRMDSAVPTLITQADPVELVGATIAQLNRIILGKEQQMRLCIACLLARGHLLIEDIPGRRQDHARARARRVARPVLSAHPVHQRPAAGRHHRRVDLRARDQHVPVPQGPGVLAARARRRGQSRHAEGAERAARGDGRAPGHGRRPDLSARRAVLRHRDAEPGVPDRHVSAARVAARSLPDAHRARLSRRRRSSASCCSARTGATCSRRCRRRCRRSSCC